MVAVVIEELVVLTELVVEGLEKAQNTSGSVRMFLVDLRDGLEHCLVAVV